ncbi:MAG: lasso RiPP family leader peptide-containing protein [Sphingomonadaceae bacterium]
MHRMKDGVYIMDTSEKSTYVKPQLNEVGSFEEITLDTPGGGSEEGPSFS